MPQLRAHRDRRKGAGRLPHLRAPAVLLRGQLRKLLITNMQKAEGPFPPLFLCFDESFYFFPDFFGRTAEDLLQVFLLFLRQFRHGPVQVLDHSTVCLE